MFPLLYLSWVTLLAFLLGYFTGEWNPFGGVVALDVMTLPFIIYMILD